MAATEPRPRITMQDIDGVMLRTAFWAARQDEGKRPLLFFNGIGITIVEG